MLFVVDWHVLVLFILILQFVLCLSVLCEYFSFPSFRFSDIHKYIYIYVYACISKLMNFRSLRHRLGVCIIIE